jgi:hypothetical protein
MNQLGEDHHKILEQSCEQAVNGILEFVENHGVHCDNRHCTRAYMNIAYMFKGP